jgi:hypothetical protein
MTRRNARRQGWSADADGQLSGLHDGLLTFAAAVGFERWLPSRRHILKTYSDFT